MLRIAVPNKGVLSEPAAEMLAESGYRQRRITKDLAVYDPDSDTEFFYLRPRDIAVYVAAGDAASGTVAAVSDGVHAAGKKVVEEAAEVWMAAEHEGEVRTAEEISQLLYRVQVLMLARGLSLEDVYAHL